MCPRTQPAGHVPRDPHSPACAAGCPGDAGAGGVAGVGSPGDGAPPGGRSPLTVKTGFMAAPPGATDGVSPARPHGQLPRRLGARSGLMSRRSCRPSGQKKPPGKEDALLCSAARKEPEEKRTHNQEHAGGWCATGGRPRNVTSSRTAAGPREGRTRLGQVASQHSLVPLLWLLCPKKSVPTLSPGRHPALLSPAKCSFIRSFHEKTRRLSSQSQQVTFCRLILWKNLYE